MCGIFGLIQYNKDINKPNLRRVSQLLSHRGPDNEGHYTHKNVYLNVRRLKVHDLSDRANQPFKVPNSEAIICFNGAISNYRRLQNQVGQKMISSSDTEVLLRSYLKWGLGFLNHLEGMFAFSIYNPETNMLLIARDRTGIKPLYYYNNKNFFIFSSEIKPIIEHPNYEKKVNEDVVLEYFSRGCVSPPDTLFSGIKQLEAGHFAIVDTKEYNDLRVTPYWLPSDHIPSEKTSVDYDELESCLETSISDALVADVEVGIQLSGGVDSSLIAHYASKNDSKSIRSYSVIFDDSKRVLWKPRSEEHFIDFLVKKFGLSGSKYIFEKDEIKHSFRSAICAHEHPLYGASTSLFYLLAKHASKESTVLLSGEGMDDLFLGYYNDISLLQAKGDFGFEIPYDLTNQLTKKGQINSGYEKANQYIKELKETGIETLDICTLLDLKFRLHGLLARNERTMMAHSLESRPPFCDHKLIEMRLKLKPQEIFTNNIGKNCVKILANQYFPNDFVYRKKIGFSSPFGDFLLDNEIWGDYLNNINIDLLETFLDTTLIRNVYKQPDPAHRLTGNNLKIMFYAINFQLWYETFFS